MAAIFRAKNGRLGNELLARLSPADFKVVARALESVPLAARHVLFHTDDPVEHVYFPLTAVLALIVGSNPQDAQGVEATAVGREGMVGYTALLGVPASLHHVLCQAPGDCLRVPTPALAEAMARRPAIDSLMKRYVAVALRTLTQAVVCNALHPVEQRFCRWLLVTQDKVPGEFPATQELLAAMLGVKRPTISLVANALQKQGIISYHRGTVRILDAQKLEQSACACYRVTKTFYAQIMG